MSKWLSAAEIAAHTLPGLPTTKMGVLSKAERESWSRRPRDGRGGGWEFPVSALPKSARDALFDRAVEQTRSTVPALLENTDTQVRTAAALTAWQRDVMEARAAILGWIDRNAVMFGKETIIQRLAGLSKAGQLPGELVELVARANAKSGRRSGKPKSTIGTRTLKYWFAEREKHGVTGLAPELTAKPDHEIPAWAPALIDLYRNPNKPALSTVLRDLAKGGVVPPSYDQARRFLAKLSPVTLNKGRLGPQALKSLKAFTRRDTSELWPTAVYSSDGHTFKATVEHPFHGQPFRPEITAVIDIATRYVTGWSVGLAENSLGVLEALSSSIVERGDGRHRGLPAIWYTDNGPGFRAELFEAVATGFYDRWGITPKNSLAYNSQARGVIERLNRTLWIPAAKKLASYKGRDADKEAIRAVKKITDRELRAGRRAPFEITWEEFKAFVQAEIDAYNERPHSGLPRERCPYTQRYRHLNPKEMWERWETAGGEATLVGETEMADLARPYERRKVARCEVRILGNLYFSEDLEAYHGEDVLVGYDIHDASRVWVRTHGDQRLIAVAELDGNRRPYFGEGDVRAALSKQEQVLRDRTKGRLALLDKKRSEVLAEAKGAPLVIEHQPAAPLDLDQLRTADAMFARLEKAEPVPVIASRGARPSFSDDLAWAAWIAANPEHATDRDRALLTEKLRSRSFAQLLELEGIDPAPLLALAA